MKKILSVLVLTLAFNFLGILAGVGWLFQTDRLDKLKVAAIQEILFPTTQTTQPATKPAEVAATQPMMRLEELLAKSAGRPPSEQLEFIRKSFDSQMDQLSRAHSELMMLQREIGAAQKQVTLDRAALDDQSKKIAAREQNTEKLAADKGFQDTLAVYQALPAKQVKTIFMGLDDSTVIQYLQAMEPRAAAKITKEFKLPEEGERLKRVLEKMRVPTTQQASTKE
jgi:hypothetical protein